MTQSDETKLISASKGKGMILYSAVSNQSERGGRENAQASNTGSLDREYDILPLSYRAPDV